MRPASFVDRVRDHAERLPAHVTHSWLDGAGRVTASLTFRDVDLQARRIACAIQRRASPGDRILLDFPPGLDLVTGFMGVLYAGCVAVPLPPPSGRRGRDRRAAIRGDAQPAAILAARAQDAADLAEAGGQGIPVIRLDSQDAGSEEGWRAPALAGDSLAFLQYTSGSTGSPKGVMVSHGNVLANIEMAATAFGLDTASRIVSWLPPHHDMGLVGGILAPLALACHAALMDPLMFVQRPLRWLAALSSQRATTTGGPSFAYGLCAAEIARRGAADLDLSALRIAYCGAEPIQAASLRAFATACAPFGFDAAAWTPCYGMSETTLMATSVAAGEGLRTVPRPGGAPSVDCGVPWGDGAVVIVDPATASPCPEGVEGEIWVSGSHVAQGYIGREEESRRVFRARTDPADGRNYLRTGDLGAIVSGRLHITGRLKNLIIVHGEKHCPEDIEATILSGADLPVSAAAAFATTSADGAESLVLMLETALHAGPAAERDRLALAARRAVTAGHGLVASSIHLLRPGAIPRTGNGKMRRDGFAALHDAQLGSGSPLDRDQAG